MTIRGYVGMLMGMDKVESATERVHVMASPELLASLEAGWTGPLEVKATRPEPWDGGPWEMAIRECPPKHMTRGEVMSIDTMPRVQRSLERAGFSREDITQAVTALADAGILFRERA